MIYSFVLILRIKIDNEIYIGQKRQKIFLKKYYVSST